MVRTMKKRLYRILCSFALFILAILLPADIPYIKPIVFLISYLLVGYDVVLEAVRNLFHGKLFDENLLMSLATIGAFFISEFPEAVAVMLFYQVGELFQSYAVNQSRKSISGLLNLRPDYANLKQNDSIQRVSPDEVHPGDIIVIKAGEKIPLDAVIIEGTTMLDTSALTGESLPQDAGPGVELLSGCVNISGLITARVTKEFGESTVNRILELVENASSKKSESEQFITKFARYYTPIVVIVAAMLAVFPPLLLPGATFSSWGYRALSFLVVSCPCALVISIPLSFFGGLGGASKHGILIKGSNYLEALSRVDSVVFDKTGTLTKGVFQVQKIYSPDLTDETLLEIAAHAEYHSSHPISLSIQKAYGLPIQENRISSVEELPGHGVRAFIDQKLVLAGNHRLMEDLNIAVPAVDIPGTMVYLAIDGHFSGYIVIADELRDDAPAAVSGLRKAGVRNISMLTGDSLQTAEAVSKKLSLDTFHAQLLPAGKVEKLEEMLAALSPGRKLVFVGDGINDAPVLARADIGIAMGGLGSDAAIEAADVVIMTDEPAKLVTAITISRKTLKIANQNIVFAIGIKILVLFLCAIGVASMWAAVFADVGVSILAILNAFRALRIQET